VDWLLSALFVIETDYQTAKSSGGTVVLLGLEQKYLLKVM
jgi:hypothetical protein